MCFVFKTAVVFLCKERLRQKKKSIIVSLIKIYDDSYDVLFVSCRWLSFLFVSDILLCFKWEHFECLVFGWSVSQILISGKFKQVVCGRGWNHQISSPCTSHRSSGMLVVDKYIQILMSLMTLWSLITVMTLITWLHWPVTEVQVCWWSIYIYLDFDVVDDTVITVITLTSHRSSGMLVVDINIFRFWCRWSLWQWLWWWPWLVDYIGQSPKFR